MKLIPLLICYFLFFYGGQQRFRNSNPHLVLQLGFLGFLAHYYHSGINHTNSMIKYVEGAPMLVYNAVATLQPLFQRANHHLGRRNCP
jgi:hypothetical protein